MALFTSVIERDPENRRLILEIRDDLGNPVPGYHRVVISLNDLEALAAADGETDVEIKFRKLAWRDAADECRTKYAYFLMSQIFAP